MDSPLSPNDAIKFAHEQKDRFDRIVDFLIALTILTSVSVSLLTYRKLQREIDELEKLAVSFGMQHVPDFSTAIKAVLAMQLLKLIRTKFSAKLIAVANQFRKGIIPTPLQAGLNTRNLANLDDQSRLKLMEAIRKAPIVSIAPTGQFKKLGADYLLSLILHSTISKAHKESVLAQAAVDKIDLVQVSPQPSSIGDYCDLYRSRVFSISGKSTDFPPLSDCPNQGAPLHPWCRHYLIPIANDSESALAAMALPPLPQEFTALARANGTPAEFMKLWRASKQGESA